MAHITYGLYEESIKPETSLPAPPNQAVAASDRIEIGISKYELLF